MAAVTCTLAGLSEASTCFTKNAFPTQKAILAYLWWKWADSSLSTATTLAQQLENSQCIAAAIIPTDPDAALIGIMNRGLSGGEIASFTIAVPVLTAATAASAITCLRSASPAQLDAIILYNQCRLFGAPS